MQNSHFQACLAELKIGNRVTLIATVTEIERFKFFETTNPIINFGNSVHVTNTSRIFRTPELIAELPQTGKGSPLWHQIKKKAPLEA